ncbi:MAG: hypothetical protein R3180_00135 [Marinobacter sp.]|nr:hypothetical protein [Marinobacter sp.]
MNNFDEFRNRLNEAIKDGDAKQVRIAEYCDVSEQAVARWKRTGQISTQNLFLLSEISGYRYLWLRDGTGEKRISSASKNQSEYMKAENIKAHYVREEPVDYNNEIEPLIDAIRKAHANKTLTEESISHLTNFIRTLSHRR